jgi:HPt (histidine-containing phosphotransfer) domain-containing protein
VADEGTPLPIFEPERLDDLSGGDAAFAAELLGMLAAEAAKLMERIDAALAAGDREGVRGAAHALKGSSATLGFAALSDSARRLELAAKTGEPMEAPAGRVRTRLADLASVPGAGA